MSIAYQIHKQDGTYFLTPTIINWIDIFIRDRYKQILTDRLNHCVDNFGLEIYAYVIMPSHFHMIAGSRNNNLSSVIGKLKEISSKMIVLELKKSNESRKEWILPMLLEAGLKNSRNKNYQLWQQNNHAEEIWSSKFMLSKIKYIHNNPLEEGFVDRAEDYLYSSAKDYAGKKSPVKVTPIELHSLF
ncbi:MAG: transposase [Bacteroidetes bacterium]|nr:MAG: transposase [Bacteroidota bacterium]REK36451.1 MAG: transposase [Bacteroidota bacterium]REK51665.1 MAG: transposase [Bacteroidota bacterium]